MHQYGSMLKITGLVDGRLNRALAYESCMDGEFAAGLRWLCPFPLVLRFSQQSTRKRKIAI